MKMANAAVNIWKNGKAGFVILLLQSIFIVLFGVYCRYDINALPTHVRNQIAQELADNPNLTSNKNFTSEMNIELAAADAHDVASWQDIPANYAVYQDVHVMMYVGFGFLMTFIKRYGYSSVSYNFLLAAMAAQSAILLNGFIRVFPFTSEKVILMDIMTLVNADYAIAAILVTLGVVIGKLNFVQLIVMSIFEMVTYQANLLFVFTFMKASDPGCSITVHMFGAYFGLVVSRILYDEDWEKTEDKEKSLYHSDLFSMIGTLFLWTLYPSFNAGTAIDEGRIRAIINTYCSLSASCLVAFGWSSLLFKDKINMVHIQNATLAGGVGVGTMADMIIQPWAGLLIGSVAGTISVFGFHFLQPLLRKYKFHDTCGVHNLHGMPGMLSGLGSILAAGVAWDWLYGDGDTKIFAATRDPSAKAGAQAVGLASCFGMAIVGGTITGFVLKLPFWYQPKGSDLFEDSECWIVADDYPKQVAEIYTEKKKDDFAVTHLSGSAA